MKIKNGLYRSSSRVSNNLVVINVNSYSVNDLAVCFHVTYADFFRSETIYHCWLTREDFAKEYTFIDSSENSR